MAASAGLAASGVAGAMSPGCDVGAAAGAICAKAGMDKAASRAVVRPARKYLTMGSNLLSAGMIAGCR